MGETHSLPHILVTIAILYIIQNFLPFLECLPYTLLTKAMKPAPDASMLESRGNWFWGQLIEVLSDFSSP